MVMGELNPDPRARVIGFKAREVLGSRDLFVFLLLRWS